MANKTYIAKDIKIEADLTDYYTKAEVDAAIANVDVTSQLANYLPLTGGTISNKTETSKDLLTLDYSDSVFALRLNQYRESDDDGIVLQGSLALDLDAIYRKIMPNKVYRLIFPYKSGTLATLDDIPSINGLASETWVNQQGFLKEHQDISGKLDSSVFNIYKAEHQSEYSTLNDKVNTFLGTNNETLSGIKDLITAAEESDEINALTTALGNKADASALNNYLPLTGGHMTDDIIFDNSGGIYFKSSEGTDYSPHLKYTSLGYDSMELDAGKSLNLKINHNLIYFRYDYSNDRGLEIYSPTSDITLGHSSHQIKDLYLSGKLSDGTNNTSISEIINAISSLQTKANSTDLTTHTGNSDIHVTSEEKAAWNNKVDQSQLDSYATKEWVNSQGGGSGVEYELADITGANYLTVNGTLQTLTTSNALYYLVIATGKIPEITSLDTTNNGQETWGTTTMVPVGLTRVGISGILKDSYYINPVAIETTTSTTEISFRTREYLDGHGAPTRYVKVYAFRKK